MIFGFAAEPIHAKQRLADEAARSVAIGAALGGAAVAIISAMIRHGRDRNLEMIPRSVDFGIIRAGEQLDKTVILRNRGADGLRITHISVQGPSFTLLEIPQMPISLAGSSSVELKLRFAPASCGGSSGTIQIEHLRTTGSGAKKTKIAIIAIKAECRPARVGP
jgi:hypothetical protein